MEIRGTCPECGYEIDDATGVDTQDKVRPEPDDLALCIRCAAPAIYVVVGNFLALRAPTPEEMVEIDGDERVTKTRAIILTMWMGQQ